MSSSSPGQKPPTNGGKTDEKPPTNGSQQDATANTPTSSTAVGGEKEKSSKKSSHISEKVGFFEQVWNRRRSRSRGGKKDKSGKKDSAGLAADDRESRLERAYHGKRNVNADINR